jgi:hypothetical protein
VGLLGSTRSAGRHFVLTFVLLADAIAPQAARGQGRFDLQPLITASTVYDSNLFFTVDDRQADLLTRVTPGVDATFSVSLLDLRARYTLDAEQFAHHPELSGVGVRQRATIDAAYRVQPRTTVTGGAEYWTTNSPSELNAETGLIWSRARADRIAAHSSIAHRLGPLTTSTIDYAVTEYRVVGALSILTHVASVGVNRRVSPRDTITADYQLTHYDFGAFSPSSHALRIGWTRSVSESASIAIDGGPRVTSGAAAPDVSASVRQRFGSGDLSLAYARAQTTAIGLARTADTQRVTATGTWKPRPTLRAEISSAFFRSTEGTLRADVQRVSIDVARRMTRALSLQALASVYVQRNTTIGAGRDAVFAPAFGNGTIPQQVVMITFVVDRAAAW